MEIIMLTKDGCGACKEFKPFAKEVAEELGFTFKILANPKMEVPFFPYFYMMDGGAIVQQWGGVQERKYRNVLTRAAKTSE